MASSSASAETISALADWLATMVVVGAGAPVTCARLRMNWLRLRASSWAWANSTVSTANC